VSQFKNKLRCKAEAEEHKAALRMKHTSACTIEDLEVTLEVRINLSYNSFTNTCIRVFMQISMFYINSTIKMTGQPRKMSMKMSQMMSMMGMRIAQIYMKKTVVSQWQKKAKLTYLWKDLRITTPQPIPNTGFSQVELMFRRYLQIMSKQSQKLKNVQSKSSWPDSSIPMLIVFNHKKFWSPAYWGILDLTGDHPETKALFSAEDWAEMLQSFNQDVKLVHTEVPDTVRQFFDEVHNV